MIQHSEVLEDTALWQAYEKRMSSDRERLVWVKKVYETAVTHLNRVCQEFFNYTMHDGTHVRNVLDAMGSLLGDQLESLTAGEMEMLILAASLHDLGMVYTEEEETFCLENEAKCREFARENCPEMLGCESKDWPKETRQWYLRTLHPFRISEVLQNEEWKKLLAERPDMLVPWQCVLAVCQAHGEEPKELRVNQDLDHLAASDADPLFCALLLRLADLLDFDDTRAPRVLYGYAADNEKSREEWDKHQASAGFRYPHSPSRKELPYKARCKNPVIEHAVRDFLDWVDNELDNCAKLQRFCRAGWQQDFPFPRAVLRSEIESDGYMGGDFCLTMDQQQVLKLLMGENLYDDRAVFVRELLQNAIDATLLRGQMDPSFKPEEARIDFWEWSDREGNLWFRIDDQGTGMTLGMMQRYFLKVGNSYYTSRELQRDLREHGQTDDFQGISQFGIGFLSCFLCGDYVEVSTLYFDSEKNRREEAATRYSHTADYGLRLEVTGLTGYYTLKSQARNHPAQTELPLPDFCSGLNPGQAQWYGYRKNPGTSVVIRLDPGKLGVLDLRKTLEKYLCAARMPVYYNNKRIGRTYREVMETVHELAGERLYEMKPEAKKKFDECFPDFRGDYPKLSMTMVPMDAEEDQILPDFSGVLVKYKAVLAQEQLWKVKDRDYKIWGNAISDEVPYVYFGSNKIMSNWGKPDVDWYQLEKIHGVYATNRLMKKLDGFSACPQTEEQLGEVWAPFQKWESLEVVWDSYLDHRYKRNLHVNVDEFGCPSSASIFGNEKIYSCAYVYQGVIADQGGVRPFFESGQGGIFLLERKWKPRVEVGRSKTVDMPLPLIIAICGYLNKYGKSHGITGSLILKKDWSHVTLREWRKVLNSAVGHWMSLHQRGYLREIKAALLYGVERLKKYGMDSISIVKIDQIMKKYVAAYLQDHYSMTIEYEKKPRITLNEKKEDKYKESYDFFPPLLFCQAASDQSRRYICHADSELRRGITADHPFTAWLLEHAALLNRYFQRQFWQMVVCLCEKDADKMIEEYSVIREQLCSLTNHHGMDVSSLPRISMEDFFL